MIDISSDLVTRFKESMITENKQPSTIESYSRDAQDFLVYLKSHHIDPLKAPPECLLWYRTYLSSDLIEADNSVRRKVIGVRQFFRFLASQNLVNDSPFDEMPIPNRDDSLDETLTEEEFESILSNISGSKLKRARDIAILNLLSRDGLKANELISLKWSQFVRSQATVAILHIPGDKSRTISLRQDSISSLLEYQKVFSEWKQTLSFEQQSAHIWLFISFKGKDSHIVLPRMTRHGLKFMLSELGEKSKVTHLHSESLRHLAIERLIKEGNRAEDIMRHLGLKQVGNIAKHLARSRTSNED